MRAKTRRGGRRKLSSATPSPSSMASPSVAIRGAPNAEDNTMNETAAKENHDVLDDGYCFPKDTCIRCDESGGILVCSEIGCPIALHEDCMSCKPTFDDEGRFYCPYCSYKRALARVNEMRRKAMAAKRALSDFIDTRTVRSGNSPRVEEAEKKKASDGSPLDDGNLGDQAVLAEKNQVTDGGCQKTVGNDLPSVLVEKHMNPLEYIIDDYIHCRSLKDSMNKDEACEGGTSGVHQHGSLQDGEMMEEENLRSIDQIEDEGIVKDQDDLETSRSHHVQKESAVDHRTEKEQENMEHLKETRGKGVGEEQNQPHNGTFVSKRRFKSKARRRIDQQNTGTPRKSPRIRNPEPVSDRMTKVEKVAVTRNSKQQQESANQFKNLNFNSGKRKRLHWSTEEEEMLKEGVQKFSSIANKNLPWRKILEFGRHIFDETRTPVDLKDKWRNILGRESSMHG